MSATSSPRVKPTHIFIGESKPSISGPGSDHPPTTGNPNSSDPNASNPSDADMTPSRKQPMRGFEWGGNLVRKTLPTITLPLWLNPCHVDVADPTELPLCWYGVPFVGRLIYPYTERIGLASYYTKQVLRAKPGDLDIFQTWANMDVWFKKQSGLQLDLNLVWGHPTPILTFFSNHEAANITEEQLDLVSDLLDDIGYGDEYEIMWYLDRNQSY